LPDNNENKNLIEQLNSKRENAQKGGGDRRIESQKKKGKLIFIPYDIQIECNYEELGEFITLLESNDRLITVDELIIKNGTEKIKTSSQQSFDQINRMTIQLSINTVTLNKSKK